MKMKTQMKTLAAFMLALPCTAQAQEAPKSAAQYRISVTHGKMTLSDVKTETVMATLRRGVAMLTQGQLRHLALDITAGIVANGDGSREHTVDPETPVDTLADVDGGRAPYATATIERDLIFLIERDEMKTKCCDYEAFIYMTKKSETKDHPPQ